MLRVRPTTEVSPSTPPITSPRGSFAVCARVRSRATHVAERAAHAERAAAAKAHLAAPNKENEEVVVVARLEERHTAKLLTE